MNVTVRQLHDLLAELLHSGEVSESTNVFVAFRDGFAWCGLIDREGLGEDEDFVSVGDDGVMLRGVLNPSEWLFAEEGPS